MKTAKKHKNVCLLVNGISKKEREAFKKKNKGMLRQFGYNIRDFDRHVINLAMKNPKQYI